MITLDTIAIIISTAGLLSGLIAFLKFVSDRPTRTELNTAIAAIQKATDDKWEAVKNDLEYIRQRIDQWIQK